MAHSQTAALLVHYESALDQKWQALAVVIDDGFVFAVRRDISASIAFTGCATFCLQLVRARRDPIP